jgi:GNAT superfamily N-acetyltransferase
VAAVYVKPEMRHRGVASMFLQEAAAIATRIGVGGLYIDCLAVTAPVYEKNGWKIYEREVGDKDSVVMLRALSGVEGLALAATRSRSLSCGI